MIIKNYSFKPNEPVDQYFQKDTAMEDILHMNPGTHLQEVVQDAFMDREITIDSNIPSSKILKSELPKPSNKESLRRYLESVITTIDKKTDLNVKPLHDSLKEWEASQFFPFYPFPLFVKSSSIHTDNYVSNLTQNLFLKMPLCILIFSGIYIDMKSIPSFQTGKSSSQKSPHLDFKMIFTILLPNCIDSKKHLIKLTVTNYRNLRTENELFNWQIYFKRNPKTDQIDEMSNYLISIPEKFKNLFIESSRNIYTSLDTLSTILNQRLGHEVTAEEFTSLLNIGLPTELLKASFNYARLAMYYHHLWFGTSLMQNVITLIPQQYDKFLTKVKLSEDIPELEDLNPKAEIQTTTSTSTTTPKVETIDGSFPVPKFNLKNFTKDLNDIISTRAKNNLFVLDQKKLEFILPFSFIDQIIYPIAEKKRKEPEIPIIDLDGNSNSPEIISKTTQKPQSNPEPHAAKKKKTKTTPLPKIPTKQTKLVFKPVKK